jgi:methyltransferase-like protein/cyclopropane fatty-acyl-phospholipid synthase-like methyltransferase
MGRLFGLNVVPPSSARVLELGCADGANLLPMADHAPNARFLGIDGSQVQITAGQRALAASGLKNVELRHQNILEFPASEGKFDYIIVHGIFSWVPEPVRQKILQICSAHLSENGVAYISYNALPGWNMRRSLRDLVKFHAGGLADPKAKVQQTRAIVKFLADSVPTENNAYGMFLKAEMEAMGKQADNYLAHDILEEENTAFYFYEFAMRAGRHGLQYLGEPGLSQMLAANFPDNVRDTLLKVAPNAVAQEQYMDFLRNRFFRQTLLCHASQKLNRQVDASTMVHFSFQSLFKRPEGAVDLTQGVSVGFATNAGAIINTTDTFLKAAIKALAESAPSILTYQDILKTARRTARAVLGAVPPNQDEIEEHTLRSNLLNLCSKGFVEVLTEPVRVSAVVPPKPYLSGLVRHQAMNARLITNWLHVGVPADIFAKFVMKACDGTRNRDEIVSALIHEVQAGKLSVKEGDKPVTAEARLKTLLAPQVDTVLQRLAGAGFLAAESAEQPEFS